MTVRILVGDVLARLGELQDESVHCVVTSPPYYALRDYGVAGQIGLEESPDAYIAKMVEVFREIRRVLRRDGTCWVNIGDSYVSDGGAGWQGKAGARANRTHTQRALLKNSSIAASLKPKDLMLIPFRLAIALQADGWWVRQDIIWGKKNPMPESVRDRCTKAHEYVFLLAKSDRYFYDAEAISEPSVYADEAVYDNGLNGLTSAESHAGAGSSTRKFKAPGKVPASGNTRRTTGAERGIPGAPTNTGSNGAVASGVPWEGLTRNKRSVWVITSKPFPEAHFATFPPELPENCIKAGTSAHGCCASCGAPWRRVVEVLSREIAGGVGKKLTKAERGAYADQQGPNGSQHDRPGLTQSTRTTSGWEPSCKCGAGVRPAVVLDPFGGAGTTALVAERLHRDSILVELNPKYAAMAERRIRAEASLLTQVEAA